MALIRPLSCLIRSTRPWVPCSRLLANIQWYSTVKNPKMPVIDALRLAVNDCGYNDLLEDGTVATWATNLSGNGVNVLGDLEEQTAHDILKKSGVRNLKLCQNVLQQAFPIEDPQVDKAKADAQHEYWSGVVEQLNKMRSEGQWEQMIPMLLEVLEKAEQEEGLHPFYIPQLFQELAQCYFHTDQITKCLEANGTALSLYAEGDITHMWMEAMHFQGLVHASMNDFVMASVAFEMILKWVSGVSNESSPVVTTAARDLKMATKAELGLVKVRMGELKEAEALLAANLVEASKNNAVGPTIRTLSVLVECFDAMKDYKRCLSVAERAIAWCQKHNREEEGQKMIPIALHYKELLKESTPVSPSSP